MDGNFETVLLDLIPIVKVERIDNDDTYQPTAADTSENETKIEFSLFVQLTVHVEKHLHEIGGISIGAKFDCDFDAIDVKPSIFDCNVNFNDETIASLPHENTFQSEEESLNSMIKHNPKINGGKWTQEKVYSCTKCNVKIARRANFMRHMRNRHPNDDPNSFTIVFLDKQPKFNGDVDQLQTGIEDVDVDSNISKPISKIKIPDEQKTFVCRICNTTLLYRKNIMRHIRNTHPTDDVYAFDIINHEHPVRNVQKMGRKMKRMLDGSNLGRKVVEEAAKADRKPKVRIPEEWKTYVCRICNATLLYRKNITRHIRKTHPTDDMYSFDIINHDHAVKLPQKKRVRIIKEKVPELIQQHDVPETDSKPIIKCDEVLKGKTSDERKAYLCNICNATLLHRKNIMRHIRNTHPTDDVYSFTEMNFDEPVKITDENRIAHPRKEQFYECYLCHSAFNDWPDLRKHFRITHYNFSCFTKYRFNLRTCKLCNEEFRDAYLFDKHKRWHKKQSDSRPHQCHLCVKAYRERHELKRHLAKHVRDFTCEICHKSYSRLNKASHMRRHSGEMRRQCDECGKFFSAPDKLKRHMRTHTGETPYECEYCHKRFRQSYNLAVHKRMHTGEYIHYCKPCEKGFGGRRELKKHNLRVHKIEMLDEDTPPALNNEAVEHEMKRI